MTIAGAFVKTLAFRMTRGGYLALEFLFHPPAPESAVGGEASS